MEPNQFVVDYLGDLPPGSMIDLAGGEGRNALWFAKRGWQVENVEISKVALDKFLIRAEREGLLSHCTENLADAKTAAFKNRADLLLVAYLQIPAAQLAAALSNAAKQLNAGAAVFGVWHAQRNLAEGFGGPPSEELLPSPADLTQWAKQNLTSWDVFEVDRIVEKEGVSHTAIDVILKGQLAKSE